MSNIITIIDNEKKISLCIQNLDISLHQFFFQLALFLIYKTANMNSIIIRLLKSYGFVLMSLKGLLGAIFIVK